MSQKRGWRALAAGMTIACILSCNGDPVNVLGVEIVEVSPAQTTILLGEDRVFVAVAKASDGQVLSDRETSWSSSSSAIATVNATGRARGMSAGSAQITATIEGKTNSATLQVNNPAPSITSLTPATMVAGTAAFTLTVNGANFVAGAQVLWNGTPRTTQRVSSTQLTAEITAADIAAAATIQVNATNPTPGGGPSPTLPFTITVAPPPPNPAPALNSVAPSRANAGDPAFVLTLNGASFVSNSVVRWNGTARTTTFVSATELRANVAAADIAAEGFAVVTVFTPAPGGGESATRSFLIDPRPNAVPRLDAISPTVATAGGAAFTLTATGDGFVQSSLIQWNGVPRATTFVSPTQMTAQVTATEIATGGTAQVTVFSPAPGGGTSAPRVFTITPFADGALAVVDAGGGHACGLKATGAAYCWGDGTDGRLGNGAFENSLLPVPVAGGLRFVSISAGSNHACGVAIDRLVYCWGEGFSGALGHQTEPDQNVPTLVVGGLGFDAVSAGTNYSCAASIPDADVWCWGDRTDGRVGDGFTVGLANPTPVLGGFSFTRVSAGSRHACALTAAGAAYCWGSNQNGRLGTGTAIFLSATPVAVTGGHLFSRIAAGENLTCAITLAGAAMCWGGGTVGDGSTTPSHGVPTAVSGGHVFKSIAVGDAHACAVTTAGSMYCWGSNFFGQLGTGDLVSATTPRLVQSTASGASGAHLAAAQQFTSVSADFYTCGTAADGNIYCWGSRASGVLGDGEANYSSTPVPVSGGLKFTKIIAGGTQTCGIQAATAQLFCWGRKYLPMLNEQHDVSTPEATPLPPGVTLVKVVAGDLHMCGVNGAGDLFCWGWGAFGDPSVGRTENPVAIPLAQKFSTLSASEFATCGLTITGGLAYCWGDSYGPFNGTGTPKLVNDPGPFVALAAGPNHACATRPSGAAVCWGVGINYQFGNGSTASSANPVSMGGGHQFSALAAGFAHTCGISATDGRVLCAGQRQGAGTIINMPRQTPTAVSAIPFTEIASGDEHVCGTSMGTVQCWGVNLLGQLGRGNVTPGETTPSPVLGPPLASPSGSGKHTCALTAAGDAYCWGLSEFGVHGNGRLGYSTLPVLVPW